MRRSMTQHLVCCSDSHAVHADVHAHGHVTFLGKVGVCVLSLIVAKHA